MQLQQTFYLLGIIYFLIALAVIVAFVVFIISMALKYQKAAQELEKKLDIVYQLKNSPLKTILAVLPVGITLYKTISHSFKKRKKS